LLVDGDSIQSVADSNTAKWLELGGLGNEMVEIVTFSPDFATPPRAPSYLRLAVLLALLVGQ
jgi:hypothetical protein